ncbi:SH2 domain-containing protein 1A-like isoform X2 [Electrophorus electricus]|uniref:SH2 domain-containing protein 1A-like isoform X2 n=1 Tax=Electrophorus electricus TaxID=8005 RepID=UPI0015D0CD44|nr:SH2 domain-containing protein 1A-like isoform X2 [Electrophorus electricus]
MLSCVYYGHIDKEGAERLLEKHGKDGSFLLRDSQSVRGAFCLCVRIEHTSLGWAVETINRAKPQWFPSLDELIECYRKHTPDHMVPLLYPLEKANLCVEDRSNPVAKLSYMEM